MPSYLKRIAFNRKPVFELGLNCRLFFGQVGNHRRTWPALEFLAKRRKHCRRANGVNFHASIAQVLGIAMDPPLPGYPTRKVPKTYPLYRSADAIQSSLKRFFIFMN